MFEAADIPTAEPGSLPHTLEWYAQAPERQKKREEEMEQRANDRNDLRNEWCNMAMENVMTWIEKVESIANLQEPQDINELLARTVHERPGDTEEIDKLKAIMANADAK